MISILTLTYKRYKILEEAIQSYLEQDFNGESEMVIINDNPEVEYVYNHPNIKIINCKERFKSILKKIEFGYKQCKYDYIYRLDDDDLLTPWALSLTEEYIKENPGYDVYRSKKHYVFYGDDFSIIYENINTGNVFTRKYLDKIEYKDLSRSEDLYMINNDIVKVITVDKEKYTMIYRWCNNGYNLTRASEVFPAINEKTHIENNVDVMKYVDRLREEQSYKESGTIELKPYFNIDYYSKLPK